MSERSVWTKVAFGYLGLFLVANAWLRPVAVMIESAPEAGPVEVETTVDGPAFVNVGLSQFVMPNTPQSSDNDVHVPEDPLDTVQSSAPVAGYGGSGSGSHTRLVIDPDAMLQFASAIGQAAARAGEIRSTMIGQMAGLSDVWESSGVNQFAETLATSLSLLERFTARCEEEALLVRRKGLGARDLGEFQES